MTNPKERMDPWKEALNCYNDFADEVIVVGKQWKQEFSFDYNNRPKFKILNTFLALLSSLSIYTLQKSKLRSKINKS